MLCDPDEEYSSDEDQDYLPSGEASEGESEEDNFDEEEGPSGGDVKGQKSTKVKKGSKRKLQKAKESKRRGGIRLQDDEIRGEQTRETEDKDVASIFKAEEVKATEVKKEEKEKQKADDLWSSFLKDVGQKPKAKLPPTSSSGSVSSLGSLSKQVASGTNTKEGKVEMDVAPSSTNKKTVTITKVFEFAGEEVTVTEEVTVDSQEVKNLLQPKPSSVTAAKTDLGANSAPQISTAGMKRPGGGLGSVLGMINKKPKISVLEKSRIDWNSFKTAEGIADDLKIHNKGKEGYVEKQKFLAQADQRQYEKERELRLGLVKR